MNVSELKAYFSEDFIEETRLLSLLPEQEQQVQDYLQGIAQRLIGDEWDFEAFPVYFAVSDNAGANAAFCPNPRYEMKDGEYVKDKRGDKIPLKTVPMIFVTKGLFEYVKMKMSWLLFWVTNLDIFASRLCAEAIATPK